MTVTLILLVGSNPLPNYLAGCALRPSRMVFVYTKQTKDAKKRLENELSHTLGDRMQFQFEDAFVEDATCATTVRRTLDPFMQSNVDHPVLLNYTGGTKVMAAHARLAFYEAGGKPEHASYLDEGGKDGSGMDHPPRMRFDDGNSKALSEYPDVPLTLDTLLALHGITHKPREARHPAPTEADARAILHKVLANVSLPGQLYNERKRLEAFGNPNEATSAPFRATSFGLSLSLPEFPTKEQLEALKNKDEKESWVKQWYAFIGGGWLEEWLGAQIRALDLALVPEVTVGVNAYRGERKASLEVDVAVIRGHRSYFISCTTDSTKAVCKSKLFEVAVRSRHLGGDLARAALVCLADDRTVSALRDDIADLWEASNTTKVFGLSDIRDWSDFEGKRPNRHYLKTWLES